MPNPLPEEMTVIEVREPGGPEVLVPARRPVPEPASGEVLIRISAAGINRADCLQRMGQYPLPPGASDILGLECSGVVERLGEGVADWAVGDRVCALLSGDGYGEFCTVPAVQCLPIPEGVDLLEAGGLPEVVPDGRAGYLLPPGDVDSMAARAVELLTDADLHRRCGRAGRERAQNFGCDLVVPRFEALYRQVLNQPPAPALPAASSART